jgi:hypothetical protein
LDFKTFVDVLNKAAELDESYKAMKEV